MCLFSEETTVLLPVCHTYYSYKLRLYLRRCCSFRMRTYYYQELLYPSKSFPLNHVTPRRQIPYWNWSTRTWWAAHRIGKRDKTHQLRHVRSVVMYVTRVRSPYFISIHQCLVFATVTYDSHANFVFITHVTGDVKWLKSSVSINNIWSTFCIRIELLQVAAGFR